MLLVLVPLAWLFYLGPFYWLWKGFFMTDASMVWRAMVVFQVMVIFLMRWLVDNRFKEPSISAWLHPFGIGYIFVVVIYSFLRWLVGAGVTWKERFYGEEESVVK